MADKPHGPFEIPFGGHKKVKIQVSPDQGQANDALNALNNLMATDNIRDGFKSIVNAILGIDFDTAFVAAVQRLVVAMNPYFYVRGSCAAIDSCEISATYFEKTSLGMSLGGLKWEISSDPRPLGDAFTDVCKKGGKQRKRIFLVRWTLTVSLELTIAGHTISGTSPPIQLQDDEITIVSPCCPAEDHHEVPSTPAPPPPPEPSSPPPPPESDRHRGG